MATGGKTDETYLFVYPATMILENVDVADLAERLLFWSKRGVDENISGARGDIGFAARELKRLRAENEKLKAALRSGVEMRRRQKVYFKERTSERLVESKQSEASFDRLAAEALGEKK